MWCTRTVGETGAARVVFDPDAAPEAVEQFFNTVAAREQLQYARWQLETCESTGRLHIQCFVQFKQWVGVRRFGQLFDGMQLGDFSAKPVNRNHARARLYPSKQHTSARGEAYEWGTFVDPEIGGGLGTNRRGSVVGRIGEGDVQLHAGRTGRYTITVFRIMRSK